MKINGDGKMGVVFMAPAASLSPESILKLLLQFAAITFHTIPTSHLKKKTRHNTKQLTQDKALPAQTRVICHVLLTP